MKYIFPACFYKEDDDRYSVIFPDLNIATYGNNLVDAVEMAEDAAAGFIFESLEHGDMVPLATEIHDVKLEKSGGFVSLLYIDLDKLEANYKTKPVKKTLTIPSWLNAASEKRNINFSQTLKDALVDKLAK